MKSGSAPRPSKATAVTGYLAIRRIRSMLPPLSAITSVIFAIASGTNRADITVTWK